MCKKQEGMILVYVIVIALIFTLVGFGTLYVAQHESVLGRIDSDKSKAFYLAEAGLAKMKETFNAQADPDIKSYIDNPIQETLPQGSYAVQIVENDGNYYALSTGTRDGIQKQLRVKAEFLASSFESAIYAMNQTGGSWAFQLRGSEPVSVKTSGFDTIETGGKDQIYGNVYADGDVVLYQQSTVKAALAPNTWNLKGDVQTTGAVKIYDTASIAGSKISNAAKMTAFDLKKMDYAHNNTHNVAKIFKDAGVSSGHLPKGNQLRDVFVKNPSDRSSLTKTTSLDDYFLEPSTGIVEGSYNQGKTPLHLGNQRIYYVDGDVWFNSSETFGFKVDGQATIVATGDIHVGDNIQYADSNSMLGLVALGKYNSAGKLISGGNISFGDPVFGTMYIVSAMMFAANDFLYNTDSVSKETGEPTTGFTIIGNFAAMDRIIIERDWYPVNTSVSKDFRHGGSAPSWASKGAPASYNPSTGKWYDSDTGKSLTSSDISKLRHYRMIVQYDDRVRSPKTRPPSLPVGGKEIFSGFSTWEEL